MPRYYVDTYDGHDVRDEDGQTYPDAETLRRVVRQTLAGMIHDGKGNTPKSEASAEVRDESGRCVMRATLTLMVDAAD